MSKDLSVIIPVFNEEDNVFPLYKQINAVLSASCLSYEIVFVDDGSADNTVPHLHQIASKDSHVCIVELSRNFGQTAALSAGIGYSTGSVLVFMDGDLQNDPLDIPRLFDKLHEKYDIVSGWRKKREDALLIRKIPSRLANVLISRVTGIYLHDYGCTLKAYRREVFKYVRLYGDMHRFIPAYAAINGASVTEIEVTHHPRRFGTSKYGISRVAGVLLDLIMLKFWGRYSTKPAHVFGLPALVALGFGSALSLFAFTRKLFPSRVHGYHNSLLPTIIACFKGGALFILLGWLAEWHMRTYHEAQNKPTYVVRNYTSPQGEEIDKRNNITVFTSKPEQ